MHSSPSTFRATRTTKTSFALQSGMCSIGTRASEQPSTSANGACDGMHPCAKGVPIVSGLTGITTSSVCPGFSVACWIRSTCSAKYPFPAVSRRPPSRTFEAYRWYSS
jgi:hypothetical protein